VRRRHLVLPIILLAATAAGCTGTPTPSASGTQDNTAMVLAEPVEPASLDPLAGYAPNDSAKIFDGLLEHQSDSTLRPVLAADAPVVSADGKSWTVIVRNDVTFSTGAPLTTADVVATYRALIDPVTASPLRAAYSMLTGVDTTGPDTVRFDLAYPYAPFPNLLVLGILPASSLATPGPVTASPLNGKPVGAGPYTLVSWTKGKQLVLAANPHYPAALGGPPKVKKVTVVFDSDDADRASRLRAGKLDGAALAPSQAATFARSDAFTVLTDHSADLRAITMPAHGPVTGDPAIRLALNEAVDRPALVSAIGGTATAAQTPVPSVLHEFVEPTATFSTDQAKARTDLLAGGWVANPDGSRSRNGVAAAFTLDYPTGDAVDKALAGKVVAAARSVGVAVTATAVAPSALASAPATDAVLTSSGNPFDPDLALYGAFDSAQPGGDPSGYADPAVTADLEAGRHQLDPAQRAVAYRKFQRDYLADPAMVCLVFLDHTYAMRANWTGYQPVTDGPSQGVTWGPWWNLAQWTPR
jgi:peptide/nickel transport system substrate-binding protein